MRSLGTATVLIALLTLTGCGSGDGDADDVPTITTRPSAPDSATSASDAATSAPNTATSATETATSAPNSATSAESEPPPTETAGPSPEPPTDTPGGPTSYRAAVKRIQRVGAASSGEVATDRFSTRDDVVYCLLDDPVIGPSCELRTGFIKDDEVCGGAAEGVGRIETFEGRARPVCNSDTIREPGAVVVEAPAVVANGSTTCAVESIGVTCTDDDVHAGFFLGPREYHVF